MRCALCRERIGRVFVMVEPGVSLCVPCALEDTSKSRPTLLPAVAPVPDSDHDRRGDDSASGERGRVPPYIQEERLDNRPRRRRS